MKILHINDFFFPHSAGPSKHIDDVLRHTLSKQNHHVITFDYHDTLLRDDRYESIPVRRFDGLDHNEIHRYIHLTLRQKVRRRVEGVMAFYPTE